jgi:hypothetical protein
MAIFRLHINSLRRNPGPPSRHGRSSPPRRAVAAAAYRAGERLRDQTNGKLYNHSRRQDVLHKEIILPRDAEAGVPAWVRDRAQLWSAAERAEGGWHARPARDYQLALPTELGRDANVQVAQDFAHRISERYGVAVDLAIHAARNHGDARNIHAHLLTTTRLIGPEGLGAKAGLDLSARERKIRQLPTHSQEYRNVRALWASLANEALRSAGLEQRIDHRSLAAQGIDREPLPSVPIASIHMERRGVRSRLADTLRRYYTERLERREARVAARQLAQGHPAAARSMVEGRLLAHPDPRLAPASGARAVGIALYDGHCQSRKAGRARAGALAPSSQAARVSAAALLRPHAVHLRQDFESRTDGFTSPGMQRQHAERVRQASVESWRQQRERTTHAVPDASAAQQGRRSQAYDAPEQIRRLALESWLQQRRQREAEEEHDMAHEPLLGCGRSLNKSLGL